MVHLVDALEVGSDEVVVAGEHDLHLRVHLHAVREVGHDVGSGFDGSGRGCAAAEASHSVLLLCLVAGRWCAAQDPGWK